MWKQLSAYLLIQQLLILSQRLKQKRQGIIYDGLCSYYYSECFFHSTQKLAKAGKNNIFFVTNFIRKQTQIRILIIKRLAVHCTNIRKTLVPIVRGVICDVRYNNSLMLRVFSLIIILSVATAIRFNYNLPKYQIQCFHESVEKNSRFQISVKGQSSTYYLHVVDKKPLHEDSRTVNAEYKYYSAFAAESEVLTFCIGNLGNTTIYFDIQFYHGIYLEDSFHENVQGRELEDLSDRWKQMLSMVESNYDIYKNQLLGRRASSERITLVLTFMVGIIILGTIAFKCIYYRKMVGYLKDKKVV